MGSIFMRSIISEKNNSAGLGTMSPAMQEARQYYQWIADRLRPVIGKRILDVGGGTGSLISYFLDCEKCFALDISEDCANYLKNLFEKQNNVEVVLGNITEDTVQKRFIDARVDTVLCTNVLEHVEHDTAMLEAFYKTLQPAGGKLALLVPAFQSLYGTMDSLAGHYRRYSKQEVSQKLLASGFEIESIQYMNSAAAFGWWLNGKLLKKNSLADKNMNSQILAYDQYCIPLLRKVEAWFSPPFGLSVVALAKTK